MQSTRAVLHVCLPCMEEGLGPLPLTPYRAQQLGLGEHPFPCFGGLPSSLQAAVKRAGLQPTAANPTLSLPRLRLRWAPHAVSLSGAANCEVFHHCLSGVALIGVTELVAKPGVTAGLHPP